MMVFEPRCEVCKKRLPWKGLDSKKFGLCTCPSNFIIEDTYVWENPETILDAEVVSVDTLQKTITFRRIKK